MSKYYFLLNKNDVSNIHTIESKDTLDSKEIILLKEIGFVV